MERFPGIAILTTNLVKSIDAAFFRRFRFFVEFKLPQSNLREKLWKQHLPPRAPLSSDISFRELADKYNFSGPPLSLNI
jgi:SpoVK/Ycf46/Vps4 family AAA+-type ATPase